MIMRTLNNQRGIALVIALLMSAAIMVLVMGTLHVVSQSTSISGAGKRYETAGEAADGAIDVLKDTINLTLWGDSFAGVFPPSDKTILTNAILNDGGTCTTSITLPDAIKGSFEAAVTITRLYTVSLPGSRLEFSRASGGAPSTAIFYRLTAVVTGPNNTKAENSALYRFAG